MTTAPTLTRSSLFVAFNCAKGLARQGYLDNGRLNRALGLAQRKNVESDYHTTIDKCDCPDSEYRPGVTCKHRLALMLREMAVAS